MANYITSILKSPAAQAVAGAIAAGYIKLVITTQRWQILGIHHRDTVFQHPTCFIAAFWHCRLLAMPAALKYHPQRGYMLISNHSDGRIIARTISWFGMKTISGSRGKKAGASAFRTMKTLLQQGRYIGITPDGPRGPRHSVAAGIIRLAQTTGVPIVPLSVATSRRRILGTWDKFHVPYPFGRAAIAWGEPLYISDTADPTHSAALLAERLHALDALVDNTVGNPA